MNNTKNFFCSGGAIALGAGTSLAIYFYRTKIDTTDYKNLHGRIGLVALIGGFLGFTTWNCHHLLFRPKTKHITFKHPRPY